MRETILDLTQREAEQIAGGKEALKTLMENLRKTAMFLGRTSVKLAMRATKPPLFYLVGNDREIEIMKYRLKQGQRNFLNS